jgi:tetratricopeptide (TPR) repeat protein
MPHALGIIVLGAIFLFKARGDENNSGNPAVPPGMSSLLPPPDLQFSVLPLYNDSARCLTVRKAALQANPDLEAELKADMEEAKAWQDRLDQASVREDPNIAPMVPKMQVSRKIGEAASSGPPLFIADLSKIQMSQQDWQEVNDAADAAKRRDPSIEVEHKQWMQKMSVIQKKLDAAMVEIDPDISPMLGSTAEADRKDAETMTTGPAPEVPDVDAMSSRMKRHQDLYQQIRDQGFSAFAKESFMLPAEDQDQMKALIRMEAYLSVWGDFYGEGLNPLAKHIVLFEENKGVKSILLTVLSAEWKLDGYYTLEENDAQTVNKIVETFASSDYPAKWKMNAWQVAITNTNNFRTRGEARPDSQTVKDFSGLFEKWGANYQQIIKASVPHDVLYDAGNGLLCVTQNVPDMLDLAIGEIDRDFNEADGSNPVRLAMDGQYLIDAAWCARGSGWANTVSDQGWKLFGDRLAKAAETLEAAFAKYPNEGEMARSMIDVELGQGQGKDRMEKWFQLAIKANPDDYDAYKGKEWYLQPRWYGSSEEVLNFGKKCLEGGNWSAKLPMILTVGIAEMSGQDTSTYSRPEVWGLAEKTYRNYLEHYPKSIFYRTAFAEHAFDSGHFDIAKEQLTILGNNWDRSTITPQKYFTMSTKLGLQGSN